MSHRKFLILYPDGSKAHVGTGTRDKMLADGLIYSKPSLGSRRYFARKITGLRSSHGAFGSSTISKFDPCQRVHRWVASRVRQSREDNAPGVHTDQQWMARIEYYGWRCKYCKSGLTQKTVTKEHIIPLSRGGSQWASNLAPACKSCNCAKCDRKPSEWRIENT